MVMIVIMDFFNKTFKPVLLLSGKSHIAAAGAAAEEGVKRSDVGKKARKKAGLGHMEGHGKKSSPWIEHVKKVAKTKGIPYGQALKIAKETYKKN